MVTKIFPIESGSITSDGAFSQSTSREDYDFFSYGTVNKRFAFYFTNFLQSLNTNSQIKINSIKFGVWRYGGSTHNRGAKISLSYGYEEDKLSDSLLNPNPTNKTFMLSITERTNEEVLLADVDITGLVNNYGLETNKNFYLCGKVIQRSSTSGHGRFYGLNDQNVSGNDYRPYIEIDYEEIDNTVLVDSIILNKNEITLIKENTYRLIATVSPENATDQTLSWSSINSSIAKVDQNGNVTAVSAGTTTITCTATDGSNISASCFVTVEKEVSEATITELLVYHPITNEILSDYEYITIEQDITAVFKIKVRLSDGSIRELQSGEGYGCYGYLPNNTATFSLVQKTSSIEITGLQPTGSLHEWLLIRLNSPYNNLAINLEIKVIEPIKVDSLDLNTNSLSLTVGDNSFLQATIYPSNATNQKINWSMTPSGIVSYSKEAENYIIISALAKGTTTITARSAENSSILSSCTITVEEEKEEEPANIIYINVGGIYVPAKAYIYYNGWKECSSIHIYNNGWQQTKKIT